MSATLPVDLAERAAAAVLEGTTYPRTPSIPALDDLAWMMGREGAPYNVIMARFAQAAVDIANASQVEPTPETPSMVLTLSHEVERQEVVDLVGGTGLAQLPWWLEFEEVYANGDDTVTGFTVTHWDGECSDGERKATTPLTLEQIVAAATDAARRGLLDPEIVEAFGNGDQGLGYADSVNADVILQLAIFGEVVYG